MHICKALICQLPDSLSYSNEISQENNQNATAKLWIQPNGTVFKQYVIYNEVTEKNINNLLSLVKIKVLYRIPEISMPITAYQQDGKVAGYLMKYHKGVTLGELMRKSGSAEECFRAFFKIASVINKLPKGVYIGDLHAGNVIVEHDDIHIIDVDGFSLERGAQISCPLFQYKNHSLFQKAKYYDADGDFCIGKSSDIACLLRLALWLLMDADPLSYSEAELQKYLRFLKKKRLPKRFTKILDIFMSGRENRLYPKAFRQLDTSLIKNCTYEKFVAYKRDQPAI